MALSHCATAVTWLDLNRPSIQFMDAGIRGEGLARGIESCTLRVLGDAGEGVTILYMRFRRSASVCWGLWRAFYEMSIVWKYSGLFFLSFPFFLFLLFVCLRRTGCSVLNCVGLLNSVVWEAEVIPFLRLDHLFIYLFIFGVICFALMVFLVWLCTHSRPKNDLQNLITIVLVNSNNRSTSL